MSNPVAHRSPTASARITADDLQVLAGIARDAPIRYRASSPLAAHQLVVAGAGGFAVVTPLGRQELRRALVSREASHDLHDAHGVSR